MEFMEEGATATSPDVPYQQLYAKDIGARNSIIRALRALYEAGVMKGAEGNVSCRGPEKTVFITPSGVMCNQVAHNDIVKIGLDGQPLPEPERVSASEQFFTKRHMSTETPLHAALYEAFPSVNAVVHTHSTKATALACTDIVEIPPFHIYVAKFGGDTIRVARPFAPIGSRELSASVVRALEGRSGCLIANHGAVVIGRTMEDAMLLAIDLEALVSTFAFANMIAKAIGTRVNLIPPDVLPDLLATLKGYRENQSRER